MFSAVMRGAAVALATAACVSRKLRRPTVHTCSLVQASETARPPSKSSTTRINWLAWSLYRTSMLTPPVGHPARNLAKLAWFLLFQSLTSTLWPVRCDNRLTRSRALRHGPCVVAIALTFALGCEPAAREPTRRSRSDSAGAPEASPRLDAGCFVSARSVLARAPGSPAPGPAVIRGWVLLDGLAADSGHGKLMDSDGPALSASWRRVGADSVLVVGFDDFLRVEMRLQVTSSSAAGHARAHSDAAFDRDPGGQLKEFRREWQVSAQLMPCDSMPPSLNSSTR